MSLYNYISAPGSRDTRSADIKALLFQSHGHMRCRFTSSLKWKENMSAVFTKILQYSDSIENKDIWDLKNILLEWAKRKYIKDSGFHSFRGYFQEWLLYALFLSTSIFGVKRWANLFLFAILAWVGVERLTLIASNINNLKITSASVHLRSFAVDRLAFGIYLFLYFI